MTSKTPNRAATKPNVVTFNVLGSFLNVDGKTHQQGTEDFSYSQTPSPSSLVTWAYSPWACHTVGVCEETAPQNRSPPPQEGMGTCVGGKLTSGWGAWPLPPWTATSLQGQLLFQTNCETALWQMKPNQDPLFLWRPQLAFHRLIRGPWTTARPGLHFLLPVAPVVHVPMLCGAR